MSKKRSTKVPSGAKRKKKDGASVKKKKKKGGSEKHTSYEAVEKTFTPLLPSAVLLLGYHRLTIKDVNEDMETEATQVLPDLMPSAMILVTEVLYTVMSVIPVMLSHQPPLPSFVVPLLHPYFTMIDTHHIMVLVYAYYHHTGV